MASKARRPKIVVMGSVRARAIRGPHSDGSGRWYWRAESYDKGTQERTTVWTGWAVREDVEPVLAGLVSAEPDPAQRARPSEVGTVRDVLESWVWHIENVGGRRGPLKPSSMRIYRYSARHLAELLGAVRIDRVTLPVVQDYRDARLAGGAAPETVRTELRVLGQAYRWWGDRSPRPLSPFPRVDVKRRRVRSRYTPTREEVLAVLAELKGWPWAAALLLYATGARPSEVRDMKWSAIDLKRAEVDFDGKTGPRPVPIAQDVVDGLTRWGEQSGVDADATVLGVTRRSFDSYFGPRLLRDACKAAGVPRFTPYGLRRAAVDAMARAGVDIATAASITGHSPEVMLRYYRTVSQEDRRRAVEVAALGSLASPKVLPFKQRKG